MIFSIACCYLVPGFFQNFKCCHLQIVLIMSQMLHKFSHENPCQASNILQKYLGTVCGLSASLVTLLDGF